MKQKNTNKCKQDVKEAILAIGVVLSMCERTALPSVAVALANFTAGCT